MLRKKKKKLVFLIANSASLKIDETLDDGMTPEGRNYDKF